ncbi:unnamed protein product [Brachionus calyciflorus]|uniref:Uncharacterized protein n=1 Tax=Brachionus calyciflorus TaxID=104777 RepID=A0A813NZU9_9BILA|nr:unnamed protein product [Brachionus calyciflorus]
MYSCQKLLRHKNFLSKRPNSLYLSTLNYSDAKSILSIEEQISDLNSIILETNKIDKNSFERIIEQIELSKKCDQKSALVLIKSLGINFIDLYPHERQHKLNYLFNDLFRKIDLKLDDTHYNSYLSRTLINQGTFDPFKINKQILDDKITLSLDISTCLVKQLCNLNETRLALNYVKKILDEQDFEVKLEKIDTQENLKFNKFYQNFLDELRNSKVDNDYVKLFNPIIFQFFKLKEPLKSLEILDKLDKIYIKSNNFTNSSLIKGNIIVNNYDEALNLLEKNSKNLKVSNFLDFFYMSIVNESNECENKKIFLDHLVENLGLHYAESDNVYLVDLIYRLGSIKKYDEIVKLIKICNPSETSYIKVQDYFFRILVENEDSLKVLLNYSNFHGEKLENLKSLLFYTLSKKHTENSLNLIKELRNSGDLVKASYFFPLISKETSELSNALKICDKNIQKILNYKRIESLLKKIHTDSSLNNDDLKIILDIVYGNDPESLIKCIDIANIFDRNKLFNTLTIFNACADKILSSRLDYMRKNRLVKNFNLEIKDVFKDFEDLERLISSLNVSLFDDYIMKKLKNYTNLLFEANLVYEDVNFSQNQIFNTLKLIKKNMLDKEHVILDGIFTHFKNYTLAYASKNGLNDDLIRQLLDDNFTISKVSVQNGKKFKKNMDFLEKKETIDSLINDIIELKAKNKDFIPSIRRLLIKLCNTKELNNTVELVNKYTELLPDQELTPIVCQDLMVFYATKTFDYEKTKFYFEKLKLLAHRKDEFELEPQKLITFCDVLFSAKQLSCTEVIEIFNWFKSNEPSNDPKKYESIYNFLTGSIYLKSTPKEYKEVVESIFNSNLIMRDVAIGNRVMKKFITLNDLDNAFEYFKFNLVNHKKSLSEVFLLKAYLKLYKNKSIVGTKLEELLMIFSKSFSPSLTYNFLFYANLMNGFYNEANELYEKKLDKKIDLNVLKRLLTQVNRKQAETIVFHVLKYGPIKNSNLKNEINDILNKI